MKVNLIALTLIISISIHAQTRIEKNIPIPSGTKLEMNFDYPELKVQTWDKNEVLIKGTVNINRGENDNSFELQVITEGGIVRLNSFLKDKENIPQRITIKKGDQEYYFKTDNYYDPEVQKFLEENGREYSYMSNGILAEISLEVFIPKGTATTIEAKYGLVEVLDFNAPLTVNAKYGGVDATVNPQSTGELIARTRYGEILTNLDIKFDSDEWMKGGGRDKWTEISAKPGTGPKYNLESKYGKVYLRKPKI